MNMWFFLSCSAEVSDSYCIRNHVQMLQILKWHLFYLPMLATMCLVDLFSYKIPMHRKWFRYKCLLHLLFDALYCFKFLYGAFASSSYMVPT
jgi:hypothetical protein